VISSCEDSFKVAFSWQLQKYHPEADDVKVSS